MLLYLCYSANPATATACASYSPANVYRYESIFRERFPAMDALVFDSNGWGDAEITALCKVLVGMEDEPGGCRTRQLWLSHNDISDEGMRILASCLGGGAMPALEQVHIYGNTRAGLAARESIRKARPEMQVHYDGMGGGRENHAV